MIISNINITKEIIVMERKVKRQGIFVPDETYALLLKLQGLALNAGHPYKKGEIITLLLNHDPIIMKFFNKLNDREN